MQKVSNANQILEGKKIKHFGIHHSHRISAIIEMPEKGGEGVILAEDEAKLHAMHTAFAGAHDWGRKRGTRLT